MVSEISIQKFKENFFNLYGVDFIDGFRLFQNAKNVVQYGEFILYDNYADEDIYDKIPVLKELFQKEDEVYFVADHSYVKGNVFVLKAMEIKEFVKEYEMDIFSDQPFFLSLKHDMGFGYCLEGSKLNSGLFFQLDLKHLREGYTKSQVHK